MGDVIHTLPAVTDASRALPQATFDWLVEESFSEIPRWHSAIRKVIPVALRRWRKHPFSAETRQQITTFIKEIKAEKYDAIIDAQGLLKSALMMKLARGKKYGYDKNSAREGFASLFYHQKFAVSCNQHAVTRIRELFSKSLHYKIQFPQPNYGIKVSEDHSATPYIIFIHATSRNDKCWQEENWVQLARIVTAAGFEVHLPWGSKAEQQRAERIATASGNAILLNKMSLTQLMHHLSYARGAVSVDTGLGHLAAALGLPNISLYGPTDPKKIGALGVHQLYADLLQDSPLQIWQNLQSVIFWHIPLPL